MIWITKKINLDENELIWEFTRASGPGGQNVNKVSSAVQLRFNLTQNTTLPDDVKQRLIKLAGKRYIGQGELIIHANRYRSQERNRQDALARLIALIERASQQPKLRHPTQPGVAAREKRLQEKHRRSWVKSLRKPASKED